MGYFCKRMEEEMMIRGYSPATLKNYLSSMRGFVKYFMLPPDKLNLEHIKRYQVYLAKEKKVSYSTFNIRVCAIRFFYKHTIQRDWDVEHIPYQKTAKKLPVVFNKKEIIALLNNIRNIEHHAIALTMYATGARLSEAIKLRIADIDSERMVIHIKEGKGFKDRIVMLSQYLLKELRRYYKLSFPKPLNYLFPGEEMQRPMSARNVQYFINKAVARANIKKKASSHTLRHSFATHLLENGVNIRKIQKLLGHSSLKSTEIYTHIAKDFVNKTKSPLDSLLEVHKDNEEV